MKLLRMFELGGLAWTSAASNRDSTAGWAHTALENIAAMAAPTNNRVIVDSLESLKLRRRKQRFRGDNLARKQFRLSQARLLLIKHMTKKRRRPLVV
jgi:hypothetical protein